MMRRRMISGLGVCSLTMGPANRNGGGVGIAKARRFSFLETGERTCGDRKLGMDRGSELYGRGEVFLRSRNAECGFAERRAAQHPCDNGAAPFHGGRRAGGVGQNIDQPIGRKIEWLADGERFAKR